jgi:prophage antirepressor-like protein
LKSKNGDVVAKNLRKDDVAKIYTLAADGKQRKVAFTNEPGVYRLILRSNKPDAEKKFQDWICREVLPQICRTGRFAIDIPMLTIQPTKYRREFPDEFYQHICRLKGKVMPDSSEICRRARH